MEILQLKSHIFLSVVGKKQKPNRRLDIGLVSNNLKGDIGAESGIHLVIAGNFLISMHYFN